MVEANLEAIRSYVETGFKVLAEIFVWDPGSLSTMKDLFESIPYAVVKLECPIEVLEEREVARGTTFVGTARGQAELGLDFDADFTLDSGAAPALELASQVVRWMEARG